MNTHINRFIFALVLALSGTWGQTAFADLGHDSVPDVAGLTVEEAEDKYGNGSGYKYPLHFEVNAKHGKKSCEIIGPDCSKACPTEQIYYQSPHHYLNRDGSRTIRVDIYFDINQPITSRDPSC